VCAEQRLHWGLSSPKAAVLPAVQRKIGTFGADRHCFGMPRYYFDVHHETAQPDHEGEELPDKHAAWKEATVIAGQILQNIDGKLKPGHDWKMEITDEFRNPLFVLHISAQKPKGA
jgi:hypothetical protein